MPEMWRKTAKFRMRKLLLVLWPRINMEWGNFMEKYIERLNIAQSHFDWAIDPEEVDVAIYELQAAELAMSRYVKELKKYEVEE